MSTKFSVHISNEKIELEDDSLPNSIDEYDENFIEVAFRYGSGIVWTNKLAKLLPNNTPVYPMDNTAQGIYTIGDIKNETNE